MARNALEAVFGALGAGVRGFGRDQQRRYTEEQDRLERENLLARQGVQDELSVASLLERGFGGPQEVRAQGQERARTALQMALQGVTAGRAGIAPSMPLPTQVQQMAAQQARPERTPVNVAGRELSLLETALERAQRQRAEGLETAGVERQQQLADVESERAFRAEEARKAREGAAGVANIRASAVGSGRPPQRPTEAQEKSYLFATRMNAANPIIEQFGPTARLDRISAALAADNVVTRAIANRALSPEEQQLLVAIRQFAEPILRKNTGAAFNREEIAWIEQQVIPVSGDTPEAQEYKRQSRLREIEAFNALASPATQYYGASGGTTSVRRPTAADYDAAFNALGPDATDEEVTEWLQNNRGGE